MVLEEGLSYREKSIHGLNLTLVNKFNSIVQYTYRLHRKSQNILLSHNDSFNLMAHILSYFLFIVGYLA